MAWATDASLSPLASSPYRQSLTRQFAPQSDNSPRIRCILTASTPPNSHFMSDAVIGQVVLRSRPSSSVFASGAERISRSETIHHQADTQHQLLNGVNDRPQVSTPLPTRTKITLADLADLNAKQTALRLRSGRQRRSDTEAPNGSRRLTERERNRNKQRRYRKKQEDKILRLEHESQELRHQIQKLQQRSCVLQSTALTQETAWKVVVEYFRVFRYGTMGVCATTTRPSTQQAFAEAAMMEDVRYNTGSGTAALLTSWARFCYCFQDVEVSLQRLEEDTKDSLAASTTMSFTVSEATLRFAFPNLCNETSDTSDSGKKLQLVQKLLGQHIDMRGVMRFEWDCAFGRVASIILEADMLTPITQLLGNLEDASIVFEKAVARPDFRSGSSS